MEIIAKFHKIAQSPISVYGIAIEMRSQTPSQLGAKYSRDIVACSMTTIMEAFRTLEAGIISLISVCRGTDTTFVRMASEVMQRMMTLLECVYDVQLDMESETYQRDTLPSDLRYAVCIDRSTALGRYIGGISEWCAYAQQTKAAHPGAFSEFFALINAFLEVYLAGDFGARMLNTHLRVTVVCDPVEGNIEKRKRRREESLAKRIM